MSNASALKVSLEDLRFQFFYQFLGAPADRILARPEEEFDTDILVFNPSAGRPFYTLVSTGLSDSCLTIPEDEPEIVKQEFSRIELMMYIGEFPEEDRCESWPVHFIRAMTAFPHLCDAWISPGLVVPNGFPPRPIMDNSKLCAAFFVPPIFENRGFQEGILSMDGRSITFLAIDFITRNELNLLGEFGPQALGSLLLQHQKTPCIDPFRDSYC
jgi:hypothetical protein